MTFEIAVAMFNSENPIGARVGDIVECRRALGRVGQMEQRLYVWIPVDVPGDITYLSEGVYADQKKLILTRTNRYQIPFNLIQTQEPLFDSLRAMAKLDPYQPFISLDAQGRTTSLKQLSEVDLIVDQTDEKIVVL